jgi:argininosuccinate lyase
MAAAASDGFLMATDIAEYLVAAGVPFRDAHEITGRIVLDCLERGVTPTELSLAELRKYSPRFGDDIIALLTPAQAVARRRATGGTAGSNLRRRLKRLATK